MIYDSTKQSTEEVIQLPGMVEQVRHSELIEDSVFSQWFDRAPYETEFTRWRVYVKVKRKSPWQKRDFLTWKKARKFVRKHSDGWYDVVLTCKNDGYRPPVVRVGRKREYYAPMLTLQGHMWCPHCRRPSVFGWFTKHHAFTGHFKPIPWRKRCGVCGIAEEAIKHYKVGG